MDSDSKAELLWNAIRRIGADFGAKENAPDKKRQQAFRRALSAVPSKTVAIAYAILVRSNMTKYTPSSSSSWSSKRQRVWRVDKTAAEASSWIQAWDLLLELWGPCQSVFNEGPSEEALEMAAAENSQLAPGVAAYYNAERVLQYLAVRRQVDKTVSTDLAAEEQRKDRQLYAQLGSNDYLPLPAMPGVSSTHQQPVEVIELLSSSDDEE